MVPSRTISTAKTQQLLVYVSVPDSAPLPMADVQNRQSKIDQRHQAIAPHSNSEELTHLWQRCLAESKCDLASDGAAVSSTQRHACRSQNLSDSRNEAWFGSTAVRHIV